MCLEEGEAQRQLEEDATDGPNIARLRPAKLKDHFGSTVMPSGHNGAVMLVVEGGTAEIDQPDLGVPDNPVILLLLVVVDEVVGAVKEEDVFWLEIGVRQTVVVHELDRVAKLVPNLPHLLDGVGDVVVVFEEVEDRRAEYLEDNAHVTMVVEPVEHLNAPVFCSRVVLGQFLQDVNFELGSFAILLHVLDYLQRQDLVFPVVLDLDDLAEGALSESGQDLKE